MRIMEYVRDIFLMLIVFILFYMIFSPVLEARQIKISRIEKMPEQPEPFEIRDWKQTAREYDEFLYDFEQQGEYLPLIRWRDNRINFQLDTPWIPSYVGGEGGGEAINVIASVLGASLAGIDKSEQQGQNWVIKQKEFFNEADEKNLILNHPRARTGGSFWYEIFPGILFYSLVDLYPDTSRQKTPTISGRKPLNMKDMMYQSAEKFREAVYHMAEKPDKPNFNWTGFDFDKMEPVYNGVWREPDGAAGIAWLQYAAYQKFGEQNFLEGAELSLNFLEDIDYNPMYEILLAYGAYTAARMNAEQGFDYDLTRFINWCFEPSDTRSGWGIIVDQWGDFDVYGLHGSTTDRNGYAFAMNTFQMAGALLPIVRYDTRYADSFGKWMLNLVNSARLFYGKYHPAEHQSSDFWSEYPESILAYEGLRKRGPVTIPIGRQVSPYVTGDAVRENWAPTDIGLYGSSHVGILGGIVNKTAHDKILKLDLLKTDFFNNSAYPTYLYYNPYPEEKMINLDLPQRTGQFEQTEEFSLYDVVSKKYIEKNKSNRAEFIIEPRSSVVLVVVPAGGTEEIIKSQKLVEGTVIDFNYEKAE